VISHPSQKDGKDGAPSFVEQNEQPQLQLNCGFFDHPERCFRFIMLGWWVIFGKVCFGSGVARIV
jgi:hypothetical protein